MRKRNFEHAIDLLFWYFIYSAPLLLYLVSLFSHSPISLVEWFVTLGFDVSQSITYTTLVDIFGTSGILPMFSSPVPFAIFAWFINCVVIHLAVDFLLFIPRLAHSWLAKFTCNE